MKNQIDRTLINTISELLAKKKRLGNSKAALELKESSLKRERPRKVALISIIYLRLNVYIKNLFNQEMDSQKETREQMP